MKTHPHSVSVQFHPTHSLPNQSHHILPLSVLWNIENQHPALCHVLLFLMILFSRYTIPDIARKHVVGAATQGLQRKSWVTAPTGLNAL
jgi:hypothetical protein